MKLNDRNMGSLIDLSQIKDGKKVKELLKNFEELEKDMKYQLDVKFEKKFNELSEKYETLQKILQGNLDKLDESYQSVLTDLAAKINELYYHSEETYIKKGEITLHDFDADLKDKFYRLLKESEGVMPDKDGNVKDVMWSIYFTMYADNMVYLDDIWNKSNTSGKEVTLEDWLGPDFRNQNYNNQSVQLWIYDESAEYYLPLYRGGYIKVTDDAVFDNNTVYYFRESSNSYSLWNNDGTDFERDKASLYYFDEIAYENALIDELEKNNYSKTYVPRKIRSGEDDNGDPIYYYDSDAEPACGHVTYTLDGGRFTFKNTAMTRYVFKLVKYVG